jgi:hypothetical protein
MPDNSGIDFDTHAGRAEREKASMTDRTIISADSHIVEPPDLWTHRIDPRFRDVAPRVASTDDGDVWVLGQGRRFAVVGIQQQAGLRYGNLDQITKRGRYADLPGYSSATLR